jgi:hypothetical protein
VFAVVKANPAMFWPAILVATLGNTLGGIGRLLDRLPRQGRLRQGALVALVPLAGALRLEDHAAVLGAGHRRPAVHLAGWLHLPFWSSVMYMAIGKFGRYVFMTVTLLYVPDGWWKWLGAMSSKLFGRSSGVDKMPVLSSRRAFAGKYCVQPKHI